MTNNQCPNLSHIGIVMRHVEDIDKIRDFYTQMLGMRVMWQESKTGSTGLQAGRQAGPTFIVDAKQNSPDSRVEFNFESPDVYAAHRMMNNSGIEVGEIRCFDDDSALFHFQDPDGYTLMIWGCNQVKLE